jgi:hypothetical protein
MRAKKLVGLDLPDNRWPTAIVRGCMRRELTTEQLPPPVNIRGQKIVLAPEVVQLDQS